MILRPRFFLMNIICIQGNLLLKMKICITHNTKTKESKINAKNAYKN